MIFPGYAIVIEYIIDSFEFFLHTHLTLFSGNKKTHSQIFIVDSTNKKIV